MPDGFDDILNRYGPAPRPTRRTSVPGFDDILSDYGQDQPAEPSFLDRGRDFWSWATSPIPAVQRGARHVADFLMPDVPDPGAEFGWRENLTTALIPQLKLIEAFGRPGRAALRGAVRGGIEEGAPSLLTPLDIATLPAAAPTRALRSLGRAGSGLYRAARAAEVAGGAGLGIEGAGDVLEGVQEGDLGQVGGGLFRAGMGGLMLRGPMALPDDPARVAGRAMLNARRREARGPEPSFGEEAPFVPPTDRPFVPEQGGYETWPFDMPAEFRPREPPVTARPAAPDVWDPDGDVFRQLVEEGEDPIFARGRRAQIEARQQELDRLAAEGLLPGQRQARAEAARRAQEEAAAAERPAPPAEAGAPQRGPILGPDGQPVRAERPRTPADAEYEAAIQAVRDAGEGSRKVLVDRLRVSPSRAARLLDRMEADGLVGAEDRGGRPVLTTAAERSRIVTPEGAGQERVDLEALRREASPALEEGGQPAVELRSEILPEAVPAPVVEALAPANLAAETPLAAPVRPRAVEEVQADIDRIEGSYRRAGKNPVHFADVIPADEAHIRSLGYEPTPPELRALRRELEAAENAPRPEPKPGEPVAAVGPAEAPRAAAITTGHVSKAFPTGKVTEVEDGAWHVRLPGNRRIRVQTDGSIEYSPEAMRAGYGREKAPDEKIVGSYQRIDRDGLIRLAKEGATEGTLGHETFHAAMDLALSNKEKAAVLKRYGNEEAAADAYSKWEPAKQENGLFAKIARFFRNIYRSFRPSAESTFERVRSGEAFGKAERVEGAAPPRYAADVPRKGAGDKPPEQAPRTPEGGRTYWRRTKGDVEAGGGGMLMFTNRKEEIQNYGKNLWSTQATDFPPGSVIRADSTEFQEAARGAIERGIDSRRLQGYDDVPLEQIVASLDPKHIVGSAGGWDDLDLVNLLYEEVLSPRGWRLVETRDGAIALDSEFVRSGSPDRSAPPTRGAPKYATAPAEPPSVRKIKPIPPGAKPGPAPLGRTMAEAGVEPHRVEHKVEDLKEVAPGAKLSRDAPRTWESLDPEIRAKLDAIEQDPAKELALYERARSGRINDVEVQTLDALVAGKKEGYDTARHKLLRAQEAGRDTGPENVGYLQAALDQVTADLARAARSDVEAGTKLGRALAARARVMNAAGKSTPDQFLKKVFREIEGVSDQQAGNLLRVLQERPQDLGDALHAAMQPKTIDKWIEAWKAGLVSGPPTQVANIGGGVLEQALRPGETAVAGILDKLIGGPRTRIRGEARAEILGSFRGAVKSLGRLGDDLRDVLTLAPEKIDLSRPLEYQVGAIGKGYIPGVHAGRLIRAPFRLLSAFDTYFKGVGSEAELHKLAWRQAKGNLSEAVKIAENPTADMLAEVKRATLERVFQDPQKVANLLIQARNQYKILHVVAPFAQAPVSIAVRTLQRSPYGFIEGRKALRRYKAAVSEGKPAAEIAKLKGEAVDKLARPLVGTMILGTFGALAKAGFMTGSGPTDPKEKNLLRDTGWQPYSFKMGDSYIPFNRFEPVSSLLGFAADMVEAGNEKQAGDLFDKGLGSIVQNLTSKTYLQGLADAANVITRPKEFASRYASNLAGSLIPNIVAKGAQAIDPTLRDVRPESTGLAGIPEHILKTVESRIPGLSTTLPARRSGTGEAIERPGNAVSRLLSPVQVSTEKPGRDLERLMVELGDEAVRSPPGRDVTIRGRKVRLAEDEYAFIQDADLATTEALRRTIRNPAFSRMDEERQRRYIRSQYEKGRDRARDRLLSRPAFRARVREALRGKAS